MESTLVKCIEVGEQLENTDSQLLRTIRSVDAGAATETMGIRRLS